MTALTLLTAALISFVPAWLLLARLVPRETTARPYVIAGYGGLIGLIVTTLIMRFLSLVGVPFSLYSMGGVALLLTLAVRFAPQSWQSGAINAAPTENQTLTRLQKGFILICLTLLTSRLLALGLEAGTRPVWAWDAKQHWTKQAKVFFELRSVVPYVSLQDWLELGGRGVYTNMHPHYPIATPLLQAWTSTALGYWHDSAVNLFWPVMWLLLGLVFYSQARISGANAAIAVGATFMALSLPYLNTHVALAGYADLLMATCYLASVAALYNWSQSRERWQLILALLAGACCLLVKNEGFYWFLSLFPGILLVKTGLRKGVLCLAALAISLLFLLWILPADIAIAGHSLEKINLGYRPDSWLPIYLSALVHDNWHFLVYLFLAALLTVPFYGHKQIPLAAVILSALGLYLALYLLTNNAAGAVRFTSLNRVFLHIAPAMAFFTLTAYLAVANRRPEDAQPLAG